MLFQFVFYHCSLFCWTGPSCRSSKYRQYRVRAWCTALESIAAFVYQMACARYGDDPVVKLAPFNHCSLLVYHPPLPSKVNDPDAHNPNTPYLQLRRHTDQQYCLRTGEFKASSNSQLENSLVVIVTWGDARKLSFFKCREGRKSVLEREFTLGHMSVFFLHPQDEKPVRRGVDDVLSQFEHGDVKFGDGGMVSTALAFRVATDTLEVNEESGEHVFDRPPCPDVSGMNRAKGRLETQAWENRMGLWDASEKMVRDYLNGPAKVEDDVYFHRLIIDLMRRHDINVL